MKLLCRDFGYIFPIWLLWFDMNGGIFCFYLVPNWFNHIFTKFWLSCWWCCCCCVYSTSNQMFRIKIYVMHCVFLFLSVRKKAKSQGICWFACVFNSPAFYLFFFLCILAQLISIKHEHKYIWANNAFKSSKQTIQRITIRLTAACAQFKFISSEINLNLAIGI